MARTMTVSIKSTTAFRLLLLLFAILLLPPSAVVALSHLSDCSSCDHSLTKPVYYGCIGDGAAYVTYDSVKVECGAALSLNATSSIPRFHYPDAEEDVLYALLMVDTTDVDPIVGTQAPFLPFPILHYGGMNIPGYILAKGMKLDIFDYDETGVKVWPFLSYVKPVPNEALKKVQPNFTPPDLNTRAFNYEFILGKQMYEKDLPLMDMNTNWEFIGFLKRTILGDPVASTYFSTGYCVKDVIQENDTVADDSSVIGVDCPQPAKTLSGIGSVPAHVAGVGGYGTSLPGGSDDSSLSVLKSPGYSGGTAEPANTGEREGSKTGYVGSGNGGSFDGTVTTNGNGDNDSGVSPDETDTTNGSGGDYEDPVVSSGLGNRLGACSAATVSSMVGLIVGIIVVHV